MTDNSLNEFSVRAWPPCVEISAAATAIFTVLTTVKQQQQALTPQTSRYRTSLKQGFRLGKDQIKIH